MEIILLELVISVSSSLALSYAEIFYNTESRSLDTIENAAFSNTHTRREQPTTSNNTLETQKGIFFVQN